MSESLAAVVKKLLEHPKLKALDGPLADLSSCSEYDACKSLCLAFLKALAGDAGAESYMSDAGKGKYAELAGFYTDGLSRIKKEIATACGKDASLEAAMKAAAGVAADGAILNADPFWKIFCPGNVGMMGSAEKIITDLKAKRKITDLVKNPKPIKAPEKEILFTSNVLLGLPPASKPIASLSFSDDFKAKLTAASEEQQLAWFDHPIQIGVDQDGNEILYGLKGLDKAMGWEKEKGKIPADAKIQTVLSITCTHAGLRSIAKQYVEEEFAAMPEADKLKHLNVMLFSEIETDALVDQVIKPCLAKLLKGADVATQVEQIREVFGVEGQYGRHYSFLKAVLAIYNAFIDPTITATFKIDIDQVFMQDSMVAETGESTLDHFKTDLWGAKGKNSKGQDIELGMFAGALCNQKDYEREGGKLFIPDVLPPKSDKVLAADEVVFFSALPQALSTEAEMMTKYTSDADVIQRIHVTGGTNGILVDYLYKFRPFAPSWIGRAEDQSFLFSTFAKGVPRLGYVHKPGLIMRHDKEAFAMEAMEAAKIGKMVGDYERMLMFSEYTSICSPDFDADKELVDPFTGIFVLPIPFTTTLLRFACKALGSKEKDAVEFCLMGAPRVAKCVKFVDNTSGESELQKQHKKEIVAWDLYYDALKEGKGDAAIEAAAKAIIAKATCAL